MTRVERPPVVTLDGPSGTGKGTLGLRLAARLSWHFLDSGALYRVVGLLAKRRGVDLNDEAALGRLAATLPVAFQTGVSETEIVVEGVIVTAAVREEATGEAASQVAAWPAVRLALVQRQHAFRRAPGLIADGRDMGTVIFPDAELKIFLTASPEIRAERRHKQLREKGFDVNLAQLLEDIRNRDERDFRRAVAPLKPAPDAEILDTTQLGIAEVEARVLQLMHACGVA